MKTTQSSRLFKRALGILPGGVDSPVRAFKSVGASPLFIKRAYGARLEDVDGNVFIDYVMSWGPLIHGHAPKGLLKALTAATKLGTSYGAGAIHLVAYRELARVSLPIANIGSNLDAIATRLARLYDYTTISLLWLPSATTATTIAGNIVFTQG